MKRLARLAVLAGLAALSVRQSAVATPFSDVPANHWAYQYIQSLAADGIIDGYPDGHFKGDRPLTRYEMAVVVARTIAKLQENRGPRGASKEDLDKLQKLIDALKDELDSLGVRVTNLEDSLDALDKRTKFAQSLSLHGVFLPNVTVRQRTTIPRTIANTTGAPVTTYYGTTVPGSGSATAPAVGTIDPFVNAFLTTDDTNNPITQAGSGIQIRQDTRFSLAYQINENLTVSLPVHVLNFEYGGEFAQQQKFDLEPGVDVTIGKAGALSNGDVKFGEIDTMTSSRTGLAFRAPQGYNGQVPYAEPYQPFQKGASFKATVGEGAFGLTDVEASFTRVDDTLINTQPGAIDPNVGAFNVSNYFNPVVPPQAGFTQTTAAAALRTDSFASGAGVLGQVYLSQKAQNGSVYVSAFENETFDATGAPSGGPRLLPAAPAFTYNESFNAIVFTSPLPAGATIAVTYRGLGNTNNAAPQRYMVHARANQKFKGYDGLEIGITLNRIFDFDDTQTTGSGPNAITQIFANPVSGYGDVSDTVLGIDFQAPLLLRALIAYHPVVFGELADSKFTPDFRNVAAVGDTAGLFGLRASVAKVDLSAQYQTVGVNFFDGAPFRYYGNAPSTFANYRGGYLPDFFGFGNDLGINQQFDNQFTSRGFASPNAAGNPNLTFILPIWNTLKATGPEYFSAFAPNSRGETLAASTPIRLGDVTFATRASYQHLEEIQPSGYGALFYGPSYASNVRQKYDTYTVGTTFKVPVFGQSATANLTGTYETLRRLDTTGRKYYPVNPITQQYDANAVATATANLGPGGSGVTYYPNYVNVRRIALQAAAALPLTRDLSLNGTYSIQRYGGSYGTTLAQNISERKELYSGGVTYSIPKTNSSLSFLARRYSYADDAIANSQLTQNREDLNFTVRF